MHQWLLTNRRHIHSPDKLCAAAHGTGGKQWPWGHQRVCPLLNTLTVAYTQRTVTQETIFGRALGGGNRRGSSIRVNYFLVIRQIDTVSNGFGCSHTDFSKKFDQCWLDPIPWATASKAANAADDMAWCTDVATSGACAGGAWISTLPCNAGCKLHALQQKSRTQHSTTRHISSGLACVCPLNSLLQQPSPKPPPAFSSGSRWTH